MEQLGGIFRFSTGFSRLFSPQKIAKRNNWDVTIRGYALYKKSINSVTIRTVIEIGHFLKSKFRGKHNRPKSPSNPVHFSGLYILYYMSIMRFSKQEKC